MGSMVQANAIAETVSYVYGIPEAAVGVIVVTLAGSVLAGGGKADLSRGGAACPIVRRDLHGGSAGGDRFVCRTYSGSLFGDHGGCFFVPQCSGRDRGVRDLAMCQLWDRAGRVLK